MVFTVNSVSFRASRIGEVTYKRWFWRNEYQKGDGAVKGRLGRYTVSTEQAAN